MTFDLANIDKTNDYEGKPLNFVEAVIEEDIRELVGLEGRHTTTGYNLLELGRRGKLSQPALTRMAILRPLKVIITNYEDAVAEYLILEDLPGEGAHGRRKVPFSKLLWIEQGDFMEHPTENCFQLTLGGMVRLKDAYIVLCEHVVKDLQGNISELHCRYFPETRSDNDLKEFNAKNTIHWLSIPHAVPAEIRIYDRLFNVKDTSKEEKHFKDHFNNASILVLENAYVEQDFLTKDHSGIHFQFIRWGCFIKDRYSSGNHLIFNQTIDLKEKEILNSVHDQ